MYFEYTITNVICVENDDFREMRRLVQAGKTYNEAFEVLTKGYKEGRITYGEYIDGCAKLDDLWNSTN